MKIDEFEGHYDLCTCIEECLIQHIEKNEKIPPYVNMCPVWYEDLLNELNSRRVMYSSDVWYGRMGPVKLVTMGGVVEIRCDPRVTKEEVFELAFV